MLDGLVEGLPGFRQPVEIQISPSQSVMHLRPVPMMVQCFQPMFQRFLVLFLPEQSASQFGASAGHDVNFQAGFVAPVFFGDRVGVGISLEASFEVSLRFFPLLHLVKVVSQTFHKMKQWEEAEAHLKRSLIEFRSLLHTF